MNVLGFLVSLFLWTILLATFSLFLATIVILVSVSYGANVASVAWGLYEKKADAVSTPTPDSVEAIEKEEELGNFGARFKEGQEEPFIYFRYIS